MHARSDPIFRAPRSPRLPPSPRGARPPPSSRAAHPAPRAPPPAHPLPRPAVQWSAPQITDQSGGMAAEAMSADQSLSALQEAGHMMQGMQQEAAAVSLPMGTAPEALPAVALEAAAPPPPEAAAQQM